MPYPYPYGYSTNFCVPGPGGGFCGGPPGGMPIQMMSADQHPGHGKDNSSHKKRKHRIECEDDNDDEDDDDDCDPLTDEKYSLTDIVKIVKRLKSGDEDSAARLVASKLKGKKCCDDDHEDDSCFDERGCQSESCQQPDCFEECPQDEVGCAYGIHDNCNLCSRPPC
jgi:hypothetical protein